MLQTSAAIQIDVDAVENPTKTIRAMMTTLDDRFVMLLKKNTMDALETILNMRRILAIVSSAPNSLVEADIVKHFLSKEVCSIFTVEALSISVLKSEDSFVKYTANGEPDAFLIGDSSSMSITKYILEVEIILALSI
jgi:hypothetical protein